MSGAYAKSFVTADAIVGSILQTGLPGVVISNDIGGSFFDLLASGAQAWGEHSVVRSPSLLHHRSKRNTAGPKRKLADVVAEPEVFGRVDGCLRGAGGDDPAGDLSNRDGIVTRSIDSWMTGRPPLRWAHFGDWELVRDQIAGATATIAKDRPVLTLYSARQERERLLSLLEALGYRVLDLAGRRVTSDVTRTPTDFGWIAVPDERAETLPDLSHRGGEEDGFLWELTSDDADTARQRHCWEVFGLPASGPLPLSRIIDASEILSPTDCYPPESDGRHSWRWLGPRPQTRVLLPCPLPGTYRIELAVFASHVEGDLRGCRVIAEGRQASTISSSSLPGAIEFLCHLDPANYAGYLDLRIVSTGNPLPANGESRILRISVESIRLSRWQ